MDQGAETLSRFLACMATYLSETANNGHSLDDNGLLGVLDSSTRAQAGSKRGPLPHRDCVMGLLDSAKRMMTQLPNVAERTVRLAPLASFRKENIFLSLWK